MGAALGLSSGLLVRPYLSPQRQRHWLLATTSCGAIALAGAVAATHPLPSLLPELGSALNIGLIVGSGWGIIPGILLGRLLQDIPPAVEEKVCHQLARAKTPRAVWKTRVIVTVTMVTGVTGVYYSRCDLMTCQPATWPEVLEIAQNAATRAGVDYRVKWIRAEPAYRTEFTADGPNDITFRIDLTSTQIDPAMSGVYPRRTIEFDDRARHVRSGGDGGTSRFVTPEEQDRLWKVRVTPRDVYRLTWRAAQAELSSARPLSGGSMHLHVGDDTVESFGVEAV